MGYLTLQTRGTTGLDRIDYSSPILFGRVTQPSTQSFDRGEDVHGSPTLLFPRRPCCTLPETVVQKVRKESES